MLQSPRGGGLTGSLPADQMYQAMYQNYMANFGRIQQMLADAAAGDGYEAILAALAAGNITNPGTTGDTTIINEAARQPRERRERNTFTGGGYARPGQVSTAVSGGGGWGNVLADLSAATGNTAGGGRSDAERAARKAERMDRRGETGSYVVEPRERDRVRTRSRTGKDGETTTTTVNVSRDGGTAVAVDAGSDGNRKRRKRGM